MSRSKKVLGYAKNEKKGNQPCHSCEDGSSLHPDHQPAIGRLRKIKGQIEGIERMIVERRYCPDILIQFRAVHSALKAVEAPIFEKHLRQCVTDAIKSNQETDIEEKISELIELFSKC